MENDLVFLNLDYFEQFINFILVNKPKYKFILVTQNSDRNFTKEMFVLIEKYVNKIYAINATFADDKLVKVPLGFNDTAMEYLKNIESKEVKTKLIYSNYKICHHSDRKECFDYFQEKDWVDFYLPGMHNVNQLPFAEFYNILNEYKYCIAPRGAGIDSHRIYESIYLGVIPIVTKNELYELYEKLPVLIIDNWNEITKEFLENNYEKLKINLNNWVISNKNWYKTKYWITNIN